MKILLQLLPYIISFIFLLCVGVMIFVIWLNNRYSRINGEHWERVRKTILEENSQVKKQDLPSVEELQENSIWKSI